MRMCILHYFTIGPLPLDGLDGSTFKSPVRWRFSYSILRWPDYFDLTFEGVPGLVGGFKHFSFSIIYGNNHPNWLIFFRGVETTNQRLLIPIFAGLFRSFRRSYSQGFVSSGSVASSNLYAWWLIWVSQAACGALDEPDWQWCFCASKASEIGSVPYIFASAWYNWMI